MEEGHGNAEESTAKAAPAVVSGRRNEQRAVKNDESAKFAILSDESTEGRNSAATIAHWTKTMRSSRSRAGLISEPATSHRPALLAARTASLNTSADDSVFYPQQHDEILQTARGLCRDYICYRLKRSGFRGRVVITKYAPAKNQQLSFDVLNVGRALEDLYPHMFRNLARQLGYILRSEEELRVLFLRMASHIVGPDPTQYRWGRILALLAVAGSLSVDCIAQGHAELIENMVSIFCEFVEARLLSWIVEHGGWDGMARIFAEEKQVNSDAFFPGRFNNVTSAICVAIFVAGITVTVRTMSEFFSIINWVYE